MKQDDKLAELIAKVQARVGWSTELKGGHWKIVAPSGRCIFAPSTTGDRRCWRNVETKLRRLGWT